MKPEKQDAVQRRRLAVAVLAVGGSLAVVALTGGLPELAGDASFGNARETPATGGRAGLDAVLDEASARLDAELGSVPDGVVGAVGLPGNARDIRASTDGGVVGYVVDCDCGEALESIEARFTADGWMKVDLGGIEGCTFVKEGDSGGWALVTANQVGASTSVVVRSVGT